MSQCASSTGDDSSGTSSGEIMLFGVRVRVDPMRKSVSMNNLSQYEQPGARESSNNNVDVSVAGAVGADTGYATADDAARNQCNGGRERKRGVPWTEDEHKLFLLGLQKVGKGDWRGISRNFVKTRTPTQVASHAQKYFLRRSNLNRRRRRSSLFDITTDSVTATPMEEQQAHEDYKCPHVSPLSGFPMAFNNCDQVNNESMLLDRPIPVLPTPNPSIMTNLNLNQKHETDPSPLSLNLSLSFDHNQSSSSFQVMSTFNNGDGMISVA